MAKIVIDIENCQQCPHKQEMNPYSTDGWDRMVDWVCGINGQKIQGAVEWHEEKKIPVPTWCPLSLDNINK